MRQVLVVVYVGRVRVQLRRHAQQLVQMRHVREVVPAGGPHAAVCVLRRMPVESLPLSV